MDLGDVQRLAGFGESGTLELKKSTAEIARAGQTLCAFLNGGGGVVLIGVAPDGRIIGQEVSDRTQQELASVIRRVEPPAPIELELVRIDGTARNVIVLHAPPAPALVPFAYDGRPYQRLGTTTSLMPQERYQQLLLQRLHSRARCEKHS